MIKISTPLVKQRHRDVYYINLPCAYDIETSSFMNNGEKHAIIYSHMFSINGEETLLRTNEQFQEYITHLKNKYQTNDKKRLVIYVHNLQYEFQFIKHLLDINPETVFSIGKKRKVIRFSTYSGIEFRCSHILTNKSLANWAKDLNMEKMTGDLIYDYIRTPETPLTPKELGYIYEDVRIIIEGIKKLMKDDNLANIPMTSTGFIRRNFRKRVLKDVKYKALITRLTMEPDEYEDLRNAFSGGDTRANAYHSLKVIKNVLAVDENSEYPAESVTEKFPMSKGEKRTDITSIKEIEELKSKGYGILFTLEMSDVETKREYTIISEHKCLITGDHILDNGRVVYADKLITTITDIDYETYEEYYTFNVTKIGVCWIYEMDYMPKPYVGIILELYGHKTTLKDVDGYEYLYNHSKGELNGVYGMGVSTPIHADTSYNPDSGEVTEIPMTPGDKLEKLEKHNTSNNRFLFYPWGVWITAYARRSLRTLNIMLEDAGVEDYYCDTDSRYIENTETARDIIDKANEIKKQKLVLAMEHQNIPFERCEPKTPKGVAKLIGEWDYDGEYVEFKTLGAKRYLGVKPDGSLYLTVSGLTKKASGYIKGSGLFNYFDDGMLIPDFCSGRKTLTYIDEPRFGFVTDYLGNKYSYFQPSGVHMVANSFELNILPSYKEHVQALQSLVDNKTQY